MRLLSVSLLASSFSLALADVQFTSPAPGSSVAEGKITVNWDEGTGTTPLSQLAGWQLFLVAGGDSDATTVRCYTVYVRQLLTIS